MAQLTVPDYHVADSIAQALASTGALSESTVEAQHVKALAVLQARTSSDSNESSVIASAITALTARIAHLRDPKNH